LFITIYKCLYFILGAFLLTLNAIKITKMRKIEHIGIAVKSLEESNVLFEKLFGQPPYKEEEVASEGVKTSFFMSGPNKIELLEATNQDSPIAKFLEKKGEGIHHIAFDVEDIVAEILRLKEEGFVVLNEVPKKGADNKLVAFLHPKGTNGVLIELCQEIK
jgi:methylmalonyl-CoA/ethylmalonyl-CoA epimerase